jgi:[ribosomal protein S18]-alanine N-acetyltransferase
VTADSYETRPRSIHRLHLPVLIRAATIDDLETVWETEREVFGTDLYPRFFFRQARDLWGGLLRVAELPSGALAGHVIGAVSERSGEGWILSLALLPAHRGKGIAEALVRDLLGVFAGQGVRDVRLTVHPDNHGAVRLYRKLGFDVIDEEPDYFGPGERRVVMRLAIGG